MLRLNIYLQTQTEWIMGDPWVASPAALNMRTTKVSLPAQPLFCALHPNQHMALEPLNNQRFDFGGV